MRLKDYKEEGEVTRVIGDMTREQLAEEALVLWRDKERLLALVVKLAVENDKWLEVEAEVNG